MSLFTHHRDETCNGWQEASKVCAVENDTRRETTCQEQTARKKRRSSQREEKNRSLEEAPSAPHVIDEKKQNPNKP
jgi:hypothetical protein